MSKLSIIISSLLLSGVSSLSHAQDFTITEMMQLKNSSLSNFESVVMAKGYELNDVDKEFDHYATFKKGHSTISYGLIKNDHFPDYDTSIIYIMEKEGEYDKMKASAKENPAHPNKTHFYKNETHVLHVNYDDKNIIHFLTRFTDRPVYQVEVTTKGGDRYKRK